MFCFCQVSPYSDFLGSLEYGVLGDEPKKAHATSFFSFFRHLGKLVKFRLKISFPNYVQIFVFLVFCLYNLIRKGELKIETVQIKVFSYIIELSSHN